MRYDQEVGVDRIGAPYGSAEYFKQNDLRFFAEARHFMPWTREPFDQLIPYDDLPSMDVLEIGTGLGSHAMLLSLHARSFTGIDLTTQAVSATSKRIEMAGLKSARALQMDAEKMTFPDKFFDFIWSWGVIHHSANTGEIIKQMHRVLRPGGRAIVMVYHRSWWVYYFKMAIIQGFLRGQLKKMGSIHRIAQENIDGAFARYYSLKEWRELVKDLLVVDKIYTTGMKQEVLLLPGKRLKDLGRVIVPDFITRFMSRYLRMGGFLVAIMHKKR